MAETPESPRLAERDTELSLSEQLRISKIRKAELEASLAKQIGINKELESEIKGLEAELKRQRCVNALLLRDEYCTDLSTTVAGGEKGVVEGDATRLYKSKKKEYELKKKSGRWRIRNTKLKTEEYELRRKESDSIALAGEAARNRLKERKEAFRRFLEEKTGGGGGGGEGDESGVELALLVKLKALALEWIRLEAEFRGTGDEDIGDRWRAVAKQPRVLEEMLEMLAGKEGSWLESGKKRYWNCWGGRGSWLRGRGWRIVWKRR